MEKMNRSVRRPGQRTAAPKQKQSPLRAVTDGEFKRREPPDLSAFRRVKIAEEPDTEEASKVESKRVLQEKLDDQHDASTSLSYQSVSSGDISTKTKASTSNEFIQQSNIEEQVAIYEGAPNPFDWALEKLVEAGIVIFTAVGIAVVVTAEEIEAYLDRNPDVAAIIEPIVYMLVADPFPILGTDVLEARRGQGDTSGTRDREGRQWKDIIKEIERILGDGRRLTPNEADELHRAVSGEGYSYWEIVFIGVQMFGGDVNRIPRQFWPDWALDE